MSVTNKADDIDLLNAELPVTAYLNPDNFKNKKDSPQRKIFLFYFGIHIAARYAKIVVNEEGYWIAVDSDGNEKISEKPLGNYGNSCDFWRGILKSKISIHVIKDGITHIIR